MQKFKVSLQCQDIYLGVFAIDINAVCLPEGAVYGQMAKQFAVRSELR